MGIDAVWKDEGDVELDAVVDSGMMMSCFVNSATWLSGTVCLRFVDPYGDTCFNQLQLPVLADEIRAAIETTSDREVRDHLREVCVLVERAISQVHTYLWFVGD